MVKTNAKIKPYDSPAIPVAGIAKCAVTFGSSTIPVDWHIINSPSEPVLAGQVAKQAAKLRELSKKSTRFVWPGEHQAAYEALIEGFKKSTLLQYFDMGKQTFIFTDAHKTGLGAMLAQGDSVENARPVAIASRATNNSEQRYPQIELEALGIDFALRRFRNYVVGSPTKIQVITDHRPLCSIFSGKRQGSIRTERVKLRHQDQNQPVRLPIYHGTQRRSKNCHSRNKRMRMT